MKQLITSCLLIFLSLANAVAQANHPTTRRTNQQILTFILDFQERRIIDVAEAMPAEKYGFAPPGEGFKGVRTFAEQLRHIAADNYILGAGTLSIRNTTGTDHLSFDAVGLPGFQFIQDPLEYDSRTHHSNMDVYDRVQRGDMMQMAAIVASFVYNAANREELLPRKPLPKPQLPAQERQTAPGAAANR